MLGRSHGSLLPFSGDSADSDSDPKPALNSDYVSTSPYFDDDAASIADMVEYQRAASSHRHRAARNSGRTRRTQDPRPRISIEHARTVRTRVEARAKELRLRCGQLLVLNAVLALLPGWKKIRDDQLRLAQICGEFPPGARWLTDTTVGRHLAKLAALELIAYKPAVGRGAFAEIAIHPRFLQGVVELQRDSNGKVIVENVGFSKPPLLIGPLGPSTSLLSATDGTVDDVLGPRPIEVSVFPDEVRQVLRALPAELTVNMPERIKWRIGGVIKQFLARGWRPEQITKILSAPLPANVERPYRLVLWRLRKNMLGSGPRLGRLQRQWDRIHAQRVRTAAQRANRQAFEQISSMLTPEVLAAVAAASAAKVERLHGTAALAMSVDRFGAAETHRNQVVTGVQVAQARFPGRSLADAVQRWLTEQPHTQRSLQKPQAPVSSTVDGVVSLGDLSLGDLLELTPSGRCVKCKSLDAVVREELPLGTPVCQSCWESEEIGAVLRREIDDLAGSRSPEARTYLEAS